MSKMADTLKKNTNKLLKNTIQHSQKMIWILPDVR